MEIAIFSSASEEYLEHEAGLDGYMNDLQLAFVVSRSECAITNQRAEAKLPMAEGKFLVISLSIVACPLY